MSKTHREFLDYVDALLTLEICALVAKKDQRDVSQALWTCCQRMRRRYIGKRARQLIAAIAASPMPSNKLSFMRDLYDAAIQ